MMYSVAVYVTDNACKTVYTRDKVFRDAVGTCERVVKYHGCYIIGEWDGVK